MPISRASSLRHSEGEGTDTEDSLEIKPPQVMVRHRKDTSHRRDKHSERSNDRGSSGGDSSSSSRHRVKRSRHRRREIEPYDKARRSDPAKRDRESYRYERKERSTGDRVFEDLRESYNGSRMTNRLLDKRRERREEPRKYNMENSSSRSRDEDRENRGEHREIRVKDLRDRREMRLAKEQQQKQQKQKQQRSPSEREKRHKWSHKHDRVRYCEREKIEKMEKEVAHREKQAREHQAMDVTDECERKKAIVEQQHHQQMQHFATKDPKETTEQELRSPRVLETERETSRRKENSRMELKAWRMKHDEKRQHSPHTPDHHSVVEVSDETVHIAGNDGSVGSSKSIHSHISDEEMREVGKDQSESTVPPDSSESSSDMDSNDESNENSDCNNYSPPMDQLAKSDISKRDSPGHVDTTGATYIMDTEEILEEDDLPPYLPAIQGCRSVEEYKCLNRIEEGTFGIVYRAQDIRTKEIVALKRLKMENEKDGFPITSLREINTLLKAQHPNIVTVREIVVGSNMDKIFIVMDYVEHDLKSLMEMMKAKNQVFIQEEVKCLMQQLLQAVAHLHDNWILHRDLKTSNLLLSHRGILKVGDFGLAREYGSPLKEYTSLVVTLWYRAPELLLGEKLYSTPIDLWSVGCIFAELLRMEALFPGRSESDLLNRIFKELGTPSDRVWPGYSKLPMVEKIPFAHYPVNNLRQRFRLSVTDLGIELLKKFLTYDPAQRITAEDALKHNYFTESPLSIDPSMFPTWPAKSEFGVRTLNASPKPPSGGKELKQLGDNDEEGVSGFHMGSREARRQQPIGGGFHLKF